MKKRIFGMLLMGAMVVASMSMFTSCKDYDDDINKNANDIAVLKTQLTTLQDALKTAQGDITTAKSAVDAAAAAAKKAQETADGATDAAKTNAASIKAANDEIEALKKLVAATAKAEDLEKVKSDLETAIETATAGKVSAEELAETLKPISAKIDAIDESINTLTTDVKALQDWKKTVDGQIASVLADLESQKTVNANFQKALNDIKSDLGTLASEEAIKAYVADQIKNLASKSEVAAAIAEALKSYTTTADLKETLKGYSTPAAVSTAIANALEGYYTTTKTDELISKLDEKLSGAIDDLKEAAQTEAQVKKIAQDAADKVSEELGEEINTLNVLVNKKLTSIVLRPEFYAHGIEAIEVMNLNDTIFDLQNAANKGKITELWGIKGSKAVSKGTNMIATAGTNAMIGFLPTADAVGDMGVYDYNPVTEGFYHINPATAELKNSEVKFYTNIAQDDWTRAGYDNLATPEYAKIDADVKSKYYKDGILEVPFSVDRNALNHIIYRYNNNGAIAGPTGNQAFISLSLSKKDEETSNDTIVTSDYAMLAPADYKIVALAGTWLTTNANPHKTADDHLWYNIVANQADPVWAGILYKEAGAGDYYSPITAFTDAYKLPVVYNSSIDLATVVKTHYQYRSVSTYANVLGVAAWSNEAVMSDALMAKLGLHYEFEAIHYLSGSNRTDEWEHIQLDGSVAYPRSVTNEGKQIPNEVATREVIGREPLVRVTLVNEAGDVLQVGYILLQITSTAPSTNTVSIDFGGDYYMNCTANADITWSQVEADILRAVGMSKAEFEASYSLETAAAASNIDVNYNNATSTATQANVKTARQYYWNGAKWASIDSYNAAVNANASLNTAKKRDAYIWPLGSVYEVVNTGAQQTTVLRWTVGSEVIADWAKTTAVGVGTTDQPMLGTWGSIERALAKSGATAANKGISQNPLSVTVAYKMKDNAGNYIESNAIYVTLNIPATKLHFAYAEISGKDLSLWYQNNSYLNATQNDESDAFEVHLNVPTPALTAGPLTDADFKKTLTETFVSNLIGMAGLDATHFNQFNTTNFGFKLVKPVKGTNATDLDAAKVKLTGAANSSTAEYDDAWIVNGVTGAKYILQVNAAGTQIDAVAWVDPKGAAADFAPAQNIVTLNAATSQISYAANKYAQDILNYSGRLNQAKTDLQTSTTEYLGVEDKTFTAFIQITQDQNKCYNLLMPNSYFKARWLRPINVYSANKEWTDALNTKQEAVVAEIVGVNDWRNMAVNGALTGASNVNAKFYGIADSTFQHFYVDASAIYTDHHLAVGSRTAIPASNVAAIEALKKTSDIPALANNAYFGIDNTGAKSKLYYINTEANVGTFHLYVPVYVAYAFGEWSYDDVLKGAFVPDNANEAPLFTQKVYAVITVKQTTNSSTQARKN